MNILIPNASGAKNLGDQAILEGLLGLVHGALPNAEVTIHSACPETLPKSTATVRPHLYYWTVFENTNLAVRGYRFLMWLIVYICGGRVLPFLPKQLKEIIRDYKKADIILYVGGGYFRSKPGITQSLNLLFLTMLFAFSSMFKAKKIIAPMSFGPFAYEWQEKICATILKRFNTVSIREEISYNLLVKYNLSNLMLSADHAFLANVVPVHSMPKNATVTIGLTLREWLPGIEQAKFESKVVNSLIQVYKSTTYIIQPIVQVQGREFGDKDTEVTDRVCEQLGRHGIHINPILILESVQHAQKTYSALDLLLGMRMHACILAFTQGVPCVAISYEHKTEGVMATLGMAQYCVRCQDLNKDRLAKLIKEIVKDREEIHDRVISEISTLRNLEPIRWSKTLLSEIHSTSQGLVKHSVT